MHEQRPSLDLWSAAKSVKAWRKFARRLERKGVASPHPAFLFLLARFHHRCGQLQRGLSIEEAEAFGFKRETLEAMRSDGILDQQRGYRRYESRDGEWASDHEMIPLFFVSDAWKKRLAPMMQHDSIIRPN